MVLTARKIAVTVNSHHRQGISVSSRQKSWTVFVRWPCMDLFCSGNTKIQVERLGFFHCIPKRSYSRRCFILFNQKQLSFRDIYIRDRVCELLCLLPRKQTSLFSARTASSFSDRERLSDAAVSLLYASCTILQDTVLYYLRTLFVLCCKCRRISFHLRV